MMYFYPCLAKMFKIVPKCIASILNTNIRLVVYKHSLKFNYSFKQCYILRLVLKFFIHSKDSWFLHI